MNDTLNLEESLKKKLDSGEITQLEFDELISKFSDLDLLTTKTDSPKQPSRSPRKWRFTGSAVVEGDDIDVPVKVSGKLLVKGDLKCPEMKVSGKTTIDGNLIVLEGIKTSGDLLIKEDAKFGGMVKVSGKLEVIKNLYITEQGKISGKLKVDGKIVSGEYLKVSGKLEADSVESSGQIKSSGTVMTRGDLIAGEFISSGGASSIGGNLEAQLVEIAQKYRDLTKDYIDDSDYEDITDLNDIGRFVTNLVGKIVPQIFHSEFGGGSRRPPRIFEIEGNVEGKLVDISYTHVKGDVIAEDIFVGPNVTIGGKIIYKNSIEIPDDAEYLVEKA